MKSELLNSQSEQTQSRSQTANSNGEMDVFENAADEFTLAIRRGESPSIEEFATRYQGVAEKIRLLFPMLAMMESPNRESMELPNVGQREEKFQDSSPEKLGDFLIKREIGRGGMGIVYEAIQESLGRRVALKLLPQRTLNATSIERFSLEAKVVANLLHSNIVPVYGIGNHDGYAYYVMQYIQGQSLDRVLVELRSLRGKPVAEQQQAISNSLTFQALLASPTIDLANDYRDETIEFRDDPTTTSQSWSESGFAVSGSHYWMNVARLGIQIASAVAYAHSRKILHRDIKPSNLIVDEAGSIWVTDFGLAKSLESDRLTRTGEVVGTLRYLPPEQMAGDSDARSDVHGIGLTLYEMLTLRPANDQADHRQLIAQVTEGVHKPPRKIDPQIPLDLETIVLKCIEREPAKRYQSADLLLEDLQRFAAGKPIAARRTGTTERVVKWARRRPAVAGLALLALLFAGLGVAGVTWKWREANRNFQQSEDYFRKTLAAVNQLLNRVNEDELFESPRMHTVRERLLQDALGFYEDLAHDESRNLNIKPYRATALQQIGTISSRLGQHAQAETAYRESLEIFNELAETRGDDLRLFLDSCDTETHLAYELQQLNKFEASENRLTSVIEQLTSRFEEIEEGELRETCIKLIAAAHSQRARVLQTTDGSAEVIRELETAMSWFEQVAPETRTPTVERLHANTMVSLATKLEKINQLPRAAKFRVEAIEILESLVKQSSSPLIRNQLANQRQAQNCILAQSGKLKGASDGFKAEHEFRRQLIRDYPEFPSFQSDFARSLAIFAGIENSIGNRKTAVELGTESVQIMQRVIDEHPDTQRFRIDFAYVNNNLGITHQMLGGKNLDSATEQFGIAYRAYKQLALDYPNNPLIGYEFGQSARNLSHALQVKNPNDLKVSELLNEAIEIFETIVELEPTNTDYIYQLAFTRLSYGRHLEANLPESLPQEAISQYDWACETLKRLIEMQPQTPRFRLQLTRGYSQRGDLQFRNGDNESWEQSLRAAHQNMSETIVRFGNSARLYEFLTISQNELAHCLKIRGHHHEALELFKEAYEVRSKMAEQHGLNDRFRVKVASSKANLGWMYSYWLPQEGQDLSKALELATAANELDSSHMSLLAFLHYRKGNFEKAKELALNSHPDQGDVETMGRLAICSLASHAAGNPDSAQAFLLKALTLKKSASVAQNFRAKHIDAENFRLVDDAVKLLQQ